MIVSPQNTNFLRAVSTAIARFRMVEPGSRVVVAVSGGPDSVALLHILHTLRSDLGCSLVVAHLDHGLRPESGEEAEFVAGLAAGLDVPSHVKRMDVRGLAVSNGIGVEDAGRRARYDFFEQIRRTTHADTIATAHHRDDALETFFLRIFRGSSLRGLGGIPPVRDKIIRPLIREARSEILAFLTERGLPYRTDETNLHSDTDRNFVRNRLLPVVAERFPDFAVPLGRTMDLIELENLFVEQAAERVAESAVIDRDGVVCLDLSEWCEAAEVLRRRVILQTLYRISGPHVRWARVHVEAVLQIASSRNPSAGVNLPGGLVVRREYGQLIFEPSGPWRSGEKPTGKYLTLHQEKDNASESRWGRLRKDLAGTGPAFCTAVHGPGTVQIPQAGMKLVFRFIDPVRDASHHTAEAATVEFDADELSFPLILRQPQPGDRFRPWGLEGSRKLKKVLADAKVPLNMRRTLPLLVKDGQIIWIPGVRRGSAAPVTPNTKRVLAVAATSTGGW